jgi:hypothetical protein
MVDDIETGKEKVVPLDEDFFDRMKDLVKDVELGDDYETGTLDEADES